MMFLFLAAIGIVIGFIMPSTEPLEAIGAVFGVGLAATIISAWLSVHYWRTRMPESYAMGIKPPPDGTVVPMWISFVNLIGWAFIICAVTMLLRKYV